MIGLDLGRNPYYLLFMTKNEITRNTYSRGHERGEAIPLPEAMARVGFGDLARTLSEHEAATIVGWFGVEQSRSGFGRIAEVGEGPQDGHGPNGRRYTTKVVRPGCLCSGAAFFGWSVYYPSRNSPTFFEGNQSVYIVADQIPDGNGICFKVVRAA